MFRIQRDIRFTPDKRPFKTNIGAALTRDGQKRSPGVLYIHIDPEGCFSAAGFYQSEPADLFAIRTRMDDYPEEIKSIVTALKNTVSPSTPRTNSRERRAVSNQFKIQ